MDNRSGTVEAPARAAPRGTSILPRYDAAVLGFRNYWYPVMWSRDLGRRPIAVTLLGDRVMLLREDGPAPPVEEDVPEQFLGDDAVICGRITVQRGNWRYAAENSFDSGHSNYLHRYGAVHSMLRKMPAWSHPSVVADEGGWITLTRKARGFDADYPGLGPYPRRRFWQRLTQQNRVSIRLPGIIRLQYVGYQHNSFIWTTPVDRDHYRLFQFY